MNFLTAEWRDLIMANYEVAPELLVPYLPKGTELDYYEGRTYVSLVGFMFARTRIFGVPIPGLGTFEEVNLRFYVRRMEGGQLRRGVVFINESVPYRAVAWLANLLYKEHYTALPTRHHRRTTGTHRQIGYYWKTGKAWNQLVVRAASRVQPMEKDSMEEFIFEHYYGYTRLSDHSTEEYRISHARWLLNPVTGFSVHCDFGAMYGTPFGNLSGRPPSTVMLAEGSAISVKWGRKRLVL